jgi:tetratricopeptide (TPR) repeat protein
MAAEFEQIAHSSSNASERLISLAAVGSRAFWMGELDKAISALREAVAAFQPEMLVTLPRDYGYDNPLYGHLYLAWAEHTAGRFTDGQATWNALWRITQNANAPYLTVMALFFGAVIARDTGDCQGALDLSQSCIALAHEHQLMFWLALAQVVHGWAQCACRRAPDGTELIEQGVQLFRAIGARTALPAALGNLAEAYLGSGSTDRGLAVVEEGLELSAKNLDRTSIGELYRLKAELLLQNRSTAVQVEACFRESLELSRTTGALLSELRCTMSYARWLANRGQGREGKQMLELVCSRMTFGEPPLLHQARQLLNEMISFGESPKQEARG